MIMFLRSVLADLEKQGDREGAGIPARETPGSVSRDGLACCARLSSVQGVGNAVEKSVETDSGRMTENTAYVTVHMIFEAPVSVVNALAGDGAR